MFTKDALTWAEGPRRMALMLGVSRTSIYQWGEYVPRQRAFEVYVRSDGLVPLHLEHYDDCPPLEVEEDASVNIELDDDEEIAEPVGILA